jgi:hypothetical protein
MALNRDKWIKAKDGLYYSRKPNRHGLILVVEWKDAFNGYKILKTMQISELSSELQQIILQIQ